MTKADIIAIAYERGAIGFDYDETPSGVIDWYQIKYAWDEPPQEILPEGYMPIHEQHVRDISHEPPAITENTEPIKEKVSTPQQPITDIPATTPLHPTTPYSAIPATMLAEKRWCVWQKRGDRKIPFSVLENEVWSSTRMCKSDAASMWVTGDQAIACFLKAGGHLGGISFALGDGWCGFDFDNVIVDGKTHTQANAWLARLNGYQEVSQSKKGIKCIVKGVLSTEFLGAAETGRQFKDIPEKGMATEVYDKRRFFFLTGMGQGEPTHAQRAINEICKDLMNLKPTPKPMRRSRRTITATEKLSDTDVLAKLRNSRQVVKFGALWAGHIGGYTSASEADMALTTILMWWCDDDTQVERLFSQSGLAHREKWNRADYRERTLAKARQNVEKPLTVKKRPFLPPQEHKSYV